MWPALSQSAPRQHNVRSRGLGGTWGEAARIPGALRSDAEREARSGWRGFRARGRVCQVVCHLGVRNLRIPVAFPK